MSCKCEVASIHINKEAKQYFLSCPLAEFLSCFKLMSWSFLEHNYKGENPRKKRTRGKGLQLWLYVLSVPFDGIKKHITHGVSSVFSLKAWQRICTRVNIYVISGIP